MEQFCLALHSNPQYQSVILDIATTVAKLLRKAPFRHLGDIVREPIFQNADHMLQILYESSHSLSIGYEVCCHCQK